MIKRLLHSMTRRFERGWSYDAAYLHEMIDASPRAAWIFVNFCGRRRRPFLEPRMFSTAGKESPDREGQTRHRRR